MSAVPDEEVQRAALPLAEDEIAPLFWRWGCRGEKIVLAVSGGPDSMAMMGLAAAWAKRPEHPPEYVVATVDHRLRPDSEAEAEMVGDVARLLGLRRRILRWTGAKPKTGIQEEARNARYQLLGDFAREIGAKLVFTAHNLEDQAETVLMRLCRGSGIGGLSAMRPETDWGGWTLVRPLLFTPRARLRATCGAYGWPFVDDPSNNDPQFTRVRLRRLMPLLAAEGLTAERLAEFAFHALECDSALEAKARQTFLHAIGEGDLRMKPIDATALVKEPHEIVYRAMAMILDYGRHFYGMPPTEYRRHRLKFLIHNHFINGKLFAYSERTTFAGLMLRVLSATELQLEPAPPRRRGMKKD